MRNDRRQAVWPAVVLAAAAWWYFPAGARRGSNLFDYRVIIVILGHFAGFLAPHWAIDWALDPVGHQLLAMVVGGIAGLIAIIGLTILLHRRLADPRIRLNSRKWDIAVVLLLWLQTGASSIQVRTC